MKDITTEGRSKGIAFPIILILAGLVLLAERNGLVDRQLVLQLLPLLPVSFGGSLLISRLRRRAS